MEWGTLCQVKVDVLLLCSEMEINLNARKQNPWRKKKCKFYRQDHFESEH